MNKGCTYIDGKVIISDENGNHTYSEYYDNLDKVLVQENVIEEMENEIQKLTKEIEKYPETKKFIPYYFYAMIGFILVVPPLMLWGFTGTNPYLYNFDTIIGPVNQALIFNLLAGTVGLPPGLLKTLSDYSIFKDKVKNADGIRSEIEFLKLQIEKEKETLVSLQEEKTRNKENIEFRSTKVDDKRQLESLRDYLKMYYDLGFNKEKYYRYYQQGILDRKLKGYYSEPYVELAKKYLENKGPVLVKKRKNSK